jgi:hypothetical protein
MAKILLSQPTFNKFNDAANDVNQLLNRGTSPKGGLPQKGNQTQRLARLTIETTVANGGLTWQAEEVYLTEAGATVAKVDGFLWTDDNPVFTLNKAKKLDVIMVSQAGRPAIDPDPAKRYWFGNPGGGGGGTSMYRFIVASDFTIPSQGGSSLLVNMVNDYDIIINTEVRVFQNKFSTANFYEGEILYGVSYVAITPIPLISDFLLDPFLAGIGGS